MVLSIRVDQPEGTLESATKIESERSPVSVAAATRCYFSNRQKLEYRLKVSNGIRRVFRHQLRKSALGECWCHVQSRVPPKLRVDMAQKSKPGDGGRVVVVRDASD